MADRACGKEYKYTRLVALAHQCFAAMRGPGCGLGIVIDTREGRGVVFVRWRIAYSVLY